MSFLRLNFIPTNLNLGLLLLRLSLGGTMIYAHGWSKLINFESKFHTFPDVIGIGNEASYILVTWFETIGALGVVLGFFTRLNALGLAIVMIVGFIFAHNMQLTGPNSGELAFIYGFGFILLFLSGAGKIAIDRKSGIR